MYSDHAFRWGRDSESIPFEGVRAALQLTATRWLDERVVWQVWISVGGLQLPEVVRKSAAMPCVSCQEDKFL